ncbi:hypothetical protein [Saccharicrinis aurantiacus]|uniref:hypothetical protein n=1 Tax=Saccharicrinis aurantiacus TaxID=1849719 RepID=UPI00249348F5|nr:hypothetical protein [Saccharicrinis aurantiacus]
MKRFDYFYYRVYALYKYSTKERWPEIPATCGVVLFQGLNILSLLFLLAAIFNTGYDFNKVQMVVLCLNSFIFNYFRYRNKRSFYFLEQKWKDESRKLKVKNGFIIIGYLIASLVSFILVSLHRDTIEYCGYYIGF